MAEGEHGPRCGQKHFEALDVSFAVVVTAEEV